MKNKILFCLPFIVTILFILAVWVWGDIVASMLALLLIVCVGCLFLTIIGMELVEHFGDKGGINGK